MPLKIKIFDKPEPDETPVLILTTRMLPDGTFEVFACNPDGSRRGCGSLWKLHPNARQQCCSDISTTLGLDLDDDDKIRHA